MAPSAYSFASEDQRAKTTSYNHFIVEYIYETHLYKFFLIKKVEVDKSDSNSPLSMAEIKIYLIYTSLSSSRVNIRGQLWILIGSVYSVIPLRRTASAHF